jgi:hypothetical protein
VTVITDYVSGTVFSCGDVATVKTDRNHTPYATFILEKKNDK